MKKILLILLMVLTVQLTWANKVNSRPFKTQQKDGTTLLVKGYGDEHFHYYTTTDGVLLYHEGVDYFIAKVEVDGSLSSTGILAHEKELRTEEEQVAIAMQDKDSFYKQNVQKRVRRREPIKENKTYFPHTGKPKALVILAEFQDTTFFDRDAKDVFDQYLNAKGRPDNTVGNTTKGTVANNYGSVKKYFTDVSYGQFRPSFDVYGPFKLSNKLKYYGAGDDDYMSRLIPEVCKLADEEIDFSQYDSNNDGNVDVLCVICAGYSQSVGDNSSDCIWPKSGTVSGGTYDGKQVLRYMVSVERNATPENPYYINGVGVFCHEFSHCLGLPDFYPTTTVAQEAYNPAMEYWDLMDGGEYGITGNNGYFPTEYTAWEREAMGWITIDTLKSAQKVTLKALNQFDGTLPYDAYRIMNDNDPTGKEYIIIENVQKTDWNYLLPASGLMITHVDYNEKAFSLEENRPNNEIGHSRYTLFAADGKVTSSYDKSYSQEEYEKSMEGDLYPGPDNITSISSFVMYNGIMNKPFYNIKEENGIITFDFLEATGIKGVKEQAIEDNKIYALDGTYMGTDHSILKKGIYIINNKKIVIK